MRIAINKTIILNVVVNLLIAILLLGLILNAILHGSDFHVFYKTAQRFFSSSDIYVLADGSDPFKYHPAWALFFSPLALFPEKLSLAFFTISQMACWFYGISVLARWLNYDWKKSENFLALLVLILNAFSAETGYGQINGFLFASTMIIVSWLEESNKPIRAGFLIALMVALKLNFALLIFYAVFKSKKTLLGFFLGGFALHLVLLPTYHDLFNLNLYQNWLSLLLGQSSGQYYTYEVQGFLRFFQILFGKIIAQWAWLFLMSLFVSIGYFSHLKKIIATPASIASFWLSGLFFFSPLAWWYQVLFIFPMAFCLLKAPVLKFEYYLVRFCLLIFGFASFTILGREYLILFKEAQGIFIFSLLILLLFFKRSLYNRDFEKTLTV